MKKVDTKKEFKLFRDTYDAWGESLSLQFEIAAELWWRGEVPAHWGYSPGATDDPRDPEAYYTILLAQETTEDLTAFGNVLARHVRLLAHMGCSY
jgi:hypothetical protein